MKLKVGFDIDDTMAGFQISYLNRFGKTPDRIITWNCENKLKFFLLTGQLSKEQIDAISEMGVSTIPEL